MTLADMGAALDSLCEVAAAVLLGGGEVSLPGLGKIKMRETAAREGRIQDRGKPAYSCRGKEGGFRARQGPERSLETVRRKCRACQN